MHDHDRPRPVITRNKCFTSNHLKLLHIHTRQQISFISINGTVVVIELHKEKTVRIRLSKKPVTTFFAFVSHHRNVAEIQLISGSPNHF